MATRMVRRTKNVDRHVKIVNRNTGTQTAWQNETNKTIADFNLIDPDNTPARGALRIKACNLIQRLVDEYMTPDIQTFNNKEWA